MFNLVFIYMRYLFVRNKSLKGINKIVPFYVSPFC